MWYELKFGLIGFVVGTIAISATTFASNISGSASSPAKARAEAIALAPVLKPVDVSASLVRRHDRVPAKPMSAWRRAYIAKHGHQPPVPAA